MNWRIPSAITGHHYYRVTNLPTGEQVELQAESTRQAIKLTGWSVDRCLVVMVKYKWEV